ncbi:hypothetical protein [Thalassospira sp.]|uniref:hypothetical protein n=1 Tax=Thalassospira sp. TaxID=1912094 RepID=UPI0027326636|nr:hypothetical protein [Thalassospira sp.]MDP2699939.1 hypothetical protein [Thalassospira sp.]
MKAASVVQVHIQHEMTLAGLPMRLIVLVVIGGALALLIPLLLRSLAIAIPSGVIGIAGSWFILLGRYRKNPFYDKELMLAPRFWTKRRGTNSILSTGGCRK